MSIHSRANASLLTYLQFNVFFELSVLLLQALDDLFVALSRHLSLGEK